MYSYCFHYTSSDRKQCLCCHKGACTHISFNKHGDTEQRILLIRHGFISGHRLQAPCCCYEGSGFVAHAVFWSLLFLL